RAHPPQGGLFPPPPPPGGACAAPPDSLLSGGLCHGDSGNGRWIEMWGLIPAAGLGSRIQPLAFSKELLPLGSRRDGEVERPRAVSEHLVDRMLIAGVDRLCIVISPRESGTGGHYG